MATSDLTVTIQLIDEARARAIAAIAAIRWSPWYLSEIERLQRLAGAPVSDSAGLERDERAPAPADPKPRSPL